MTIKCKNYIYRLSNNPFSFPRHRQILKEWQIFIQIARKYHKAMILYSKNKRVFKLKDFGIIILAREYYNLVRKIVANKN